MKKYTNVLFDWDGTLVRTPDIWFTSLKSVLKKYHYEFANQDISVDYDLFRQRFELRENISADKIIQEALMLSKNATSTVSLYPKVAQTLKYLNDHGVRLALVTTSTHAEVDPLLKKHELNTLFAAIVCAEDTEQIKPHPAPLLKAMQLVGASSDQTLIVGDSSNDIVAAHQAGITPVLFNHQSHQHYRNVETLLLSEPTYVVEHINDVIPLALGE